MHVKPILKVSYATGMIMKAIIRSFHLDLTQIFIMLAEMPDVVRGIFRKI